MSISILRIWLCWALVTAVACGSAHVVLAAREGAASSRGALKQRLTNVNRQKDAVKSKLRQTKIQQRNVMGQLASTQRRLETAQDKVTHNKLELARVQEKLRIIGERLRRMQRQLERRKNLLARRLVDVYEGEDIRYVSVLLGSRDMGAFLSRGHYVREIVSSDVDLIREIKKAQEQIERDRRAQAAEERRLSMLQAELVRERDAVADLAGQKEDELRAIEHSRELYERALAELTAKSEEIEAAIRRLQSTPRGQKRYAQKFVGGLMLPVSGAVTSRFGYRVHPITGVYSLHRGVDIRCPTGTSVKAAADGEVIMAGWMGAYGYAVVIDHGGGVSTLYGHNSRLLVGVGQEVKQGQVIARSGSTGWSTGPHVHFEKRVNGKPVNPF